jgi:hypothetical protein
MAFVTKYFGEISYGDSRKKSSPSVVEVAKADYDAWNDAADFAAALVTPLGLYFAAEAALSASSVLSWRVYTEVVNDTFAYPAPDDDVYNFDKLNVSYRAGLDGYNKTIPGRDGAAYTVADDGVTVIATDPGWTAAVEAYITQFNATVLAKNGGSAVFQKMYVGS